MQFIAMLIMFFSFDDGLTALKRACSLCFDHNIQNSIYNDFFDERSAYYNYDEDRIYFNLHDSYWLDPEANQKKEFDRGWYSTSNRDHIILHEIGHSLLRRKIGVDKYRKLIGIKMKLDIITIERQVGKYACRDVLEFYAEVYAAVRSGIKYGENIIKEYDEIWNL